MQGISIFQQIYAPRVAHVVTDFDGISHNTHSPYAIGGVVGSVGKMTAIVANNQADTWHIVNLKCGNLFDAVAVLGAFDESEAANMAMRYHGQYFDAVCGDVCESNTGGLQRFLNHHFYMSTNRPVYAEELAKLQDIPSTQSILWDGVQLKSHNGSSKHLLLDMMRCDDDKALLEKMDFVEEESQLDGEIAEYDALVVEAYKLESTVSKLALAMDKATSISTLKVANQTLSKPKTMRGFGVIQQLVSFELSDGQAVSIIFNVSDSEANASAKMTKDDLLVAWKYKLNSRDITAAVQPNATQNVSLNMIASRIMGLADANSEKFVAAQKKKDAMQTELANTNQQVKDLQGQEQALLQEIADLQKQLDEKAKNKALQEAESRAEIEGMGKVVQSAPQDRPTDYRTNLANARAVAESLGIETKEVIKQNNLKGISENGHYASLTFSDEKQKFVKTTIYLENKNLPKNGDYIVVTYEIDKRDKDPKSIGGVVDYGGDYDKILDVYANDNVNKHGYSLLQRGTISKRLKKEIADLEAEKESKFIDNPKKKLGDEDKFTLPTNSTEPTQQPVQTVSEPSKPLSDIVIKALLSQDSEAWYTDDYDDVKMIYSADERDGFFIRISDKSKQVDLTYTDWETGKKQNETFVADTISPDQVIDRIKAFIAKYEQYSVELSPVQTVSKPPVVEQDNAEKNMTAADFLALGGKEWVKDDMTRIYINAKVFNDLMGTSFGDSNNKFFFDVNTSALMRSYKGKKPQVEKQYEPVQQQSSEPVSKPPMTNPDRDYLQSIIDGKADLSNADEIEAKLTDISERLDAELEPLFEQAAEAFAQYGIAQAAMN